MPLEQELEGEVRGPRGRVGAPEDGPAHERGAARRVRGAAAGDHRGGQGDARADAARAGRRHLDARDHCSPAAARYCGSSTACFTSRPSCPSRLADSPLTCVVVGAGQALEEFDAARGGGRATHEAALAAPAPRLVRPPAPPLARAMTAFVTAGAGFLLAVLWFDLMFDVQVRRPSETRRGRRLDRRLLPAGDAGGVPDEPAGRGRDARHARGARLRRWRSGDAPRWASASRSRWRWARRACGHAHVRQRGAARDAEGPVRAPGRLARLMLRDHVVCLAAIVTVLVLQLGFAR